MSLSAESREVNSDVAHGNSVYSFVVNGSNSDGHTGLFKVNATAASPRAIDVHSGFFFMNVTFTMMLPANASYFSEFNLMATFSLGPNPDYEFSRSVAYGDNFDDRFLVDGVPMGGTGVGLWIVTVWTGILSPPTVDISQNQSWLSLTSHAETRLSMLMEGDGNMTAANGTSYSYWLSTSFNFRGTPATFYGFGVSVGAWLVYGGLILVGVASLYYLRRLRRKEIRKKSDSGVRRLI
jgi:hypothetical protein